MYISEKSVWRMKEEKKSRSRRREISRSSSEQEQPLKSIAKRGHGAARRKYREVIVARRNSTCAFCTTALSVTGFRVSGPNSSIDHRRLEKRKIRDERWGRNVGRPLRRSSREGGGGRRRLTQIEKGDILRRVSRSSWRFNTLPVRVLLTRLSVSLLTPSAVRAHLLTSDNLSTRSNRRQRGSPISVYLEEERKISLTSYSIGRPIWYNSIAYTNTKLRF